MSDNTETTESEENPKVEIVNGKKVLTYRKTKEQERIEATEKAMQAKKGGKK